MKFLGVITLVGLCASWSLATASSAGEIKLITYYPAPFGAYDRLRLVPREALDSEECNHNTWGTFYIDNELGAIVLCSSLGEDLMTIATKQDIDGNIGLTGWQVYCVPDPRPKKGMMICVRMNSKNGATEAKAYYHESPPKWIVEEPPFPFSLKDGHYRLFCGSLPNVAGGAHLNICTRVDMDSGKTEIRFLNLTSEEMWGDIQNPW